MANRKVDDTSLASVADAIRSKGGTSDALCSLMDLYLQSLQFKPGEAMERAGIFLL